VTAGTDVAFAYALLRCGTPADFARQPGQRLRLTLGLRKTDDRWTVLHEHHSFPDTTSAPSAFVARWGNGHQMNPIREPWSETVGLDGREVLDATETPVQSYLGIDVAILCSSDVPPKPGVIRPVDP
jgi:hypothetical protein